MSKRNQIDNGIFGKMSSQELDKVRSEAVQDSKIRLCSTYMTPSRDIVPIAEALVAYCTKTDNIVKFIAAHVPQHQNSYHKGIKFLISKDQNGDHKPVVVCNNGKPPPNKNGKPIIWNPHYLAAFLDYSKLPMDHQHAEFRLLRAYRAGVRSKHRFELLSFATPAPGMPVDKRTIKLDAPFNSVPPIHLARCHKSMYWFQEQIIFELSDFSGVDLSPALGLGIKRKLDQAVQTGNMTPQVEEEILHDHSEDPVEVSTPLAQDIKDHGKNMVQDEEGRPFFVPDNPLLQTMPEKQAKEDEIELFD